MYVYVLNKVTITSWPGPDSCRLANIASQLHVCPRHAYDPRPYRCVLEGQVSALSRMQMAFGEMKLELAIRRSVSSSGLASGTRRIGIRVLVTGDSSALCNECTTARCRGLRRDMFATSSVCLSCAYERVSVDCREEVPVALAVTCRLSHARFVC